MFHSRDGGTNRSPSRRRTGLGNPAARTHGLHWTLIWAALLVSSIAPAGQAWGQANKVLGVRLISEKSNEVVLEVRYHYRGDRGTTVAIGAQMARNGKTLKHYAYKPARAKVGQHRARVTLAVTKSAPKAISSNQIVVTMYVGGGSAFVRQHFAYNKTWARTPLPLKAVSSVAQMATKPALKVFAQKGQSGGTPRRKILADGSVEVTYPDGTKKRFFGGGIEITTPDGKKMMQMHVSAQGATVPSYPPDAQHASWLDEKGASLLQIMRVLVENDQSSIDSYLAKEGPSASPYGRIEGRIQAIDYMLRP